MLAGIVILLVGLVLRLINLDIPTGLWADEMTSYLGVQSPGKNIGWLVMHPVYFVIYKIWITLFGSSDIAIRLMSALFDTASVVLAYFVGEQLARMINKPKYIIGLSNMLLWAISGAFVYFAHEAQFWALAFFFVNLFLFCWLRYLESPVLKNFILFLAANVLLLYTYLTPAPFVLIVMAVTAYDFWKNKRDLEDFAIWGTVFIPAILLSRFLPSTLMYRFTGTPVDLSFLLMLLQNGLTPVLKGISYNLSGYQHTFYEMLATSAGWSIIIPLTTALALIAFGLAREKDRVVKYLVLIPLIFIAFNMIASYLSEYKVMVRFTLIVLPFILLLIAVGFSTVKRTKVKIALVVTFVALTLSGLFESKSEVFCYRPKGYKQFVSQLPVFNSKITVLAPANVDLLGKYYKFKGDTYDWPQWLWDNEQLKVLLSEKELEDFYSGAKTHQEIFKKFLSEEKPSEAFEKYVMSKASDNVILIADNKIDGLPSHKITSIVNSAEYENNNFHDLRLARMFDNLYKILDKNMVLTQSIVNKDNKIYIFSKK